MADREPSASVSFDRAAAYYDATRRLSAESERAVAELLVGELQGRGTCLEVGVGTGRIALPVAARHVPMVGVDLSPPMLERLQAKQSAAAEAPALAVAVAVADATRLPLADHSVGGSLLCHVLHLVPAWRQVVDELVRVTRPGGVVLVDRGGFTGDAREVQEHLAEIAGIERVHPGLGRDDDLDGAFAAHGARVRELPPIVEERTVALGVMLDLFEANQFSWTWSLDDDTRRRAAAATREWAATRFGDLDQPRLRHEPMVWLAYDLP